MCFPDGSCKDQGSGQGRYISNRKRKWKNDSNVNSATQIFVIVKILIYKWYSRVDADCTPKKTVEKCEKCLSKDQCIEGYCCPAMRVCVKSTSTECHQSAHCKEMCYDDHDQSKCNCKENLLKWAKPTCGGK